MSKYGVWIRNLFDSIVKPDDRGSTDSLYGLFRIAAIATASIFIFAILLAIIGKEGGQFGDFVGGTLNPILTFLTFMGLIVTIVLQQQELADTRVELKRSAEALENQSRALDSQLVALHKQNFETTFFQMLVLHNEFVKAMAIHGRGQGTIAGRDCFKFFYKQLKNFYGLHPGLTETQRISFMNDHFWNEHQQDLSHYYRYFYNIIRFIDESDVEKIKYMRILRAQLSDYELLVMHYNGLSEKAKKSKNYIEKYSFLNNLPKHLLLLSTHADFYVREAYSEMDEDDVRANGEEDVETNLPTIS